MQAGQIIKNEEVLSPEYLPEFLPHRETQIKQIAASLEPIAKGRKPQNIFVFGGPGLGKTAVAKFVFRKFEEEYTNVKTVYLNCWDYNTANAVLSELTIQLGLPVQRRGWAKDEIMNRFVEALKKTKKNLVICLDEVDQLIRQGQEVLYDLLRIKERAQKDIGIIFISNNPHVFAFVEPRILSSLNIDEIEFKPYTFSEMKDILQERVRYGLTAVEEGVVALAASHAINKGGDVRVGLQTLLKAARLAEQERAEKLKVSHMKKVLLEITEVKPKIIKNRVTEVEKIIIDIVNKEGKIPFKELYEKYSKKVLRPITERRFWDYVGHLAELKMISLAEKSGRERIVSKI
jgi:cell division control protein 6